MSKMKVDFSSWIRRLIAGALVIFNSPVFACMAQGGMFIPIGIFAYLYSPWSPIVWFSETKWLVTHSIFIPRWYEVAIDCLSVFLIAAGSAVSLMAFIQLAKRRKGLVTTGLYSMVRHPQYFGIILAFLGFSLLSKKPIAILAWITLVFGYLMLAVIEEKHLQRRYGDIFDSYKHRVPFIVPFIPHKVRSVTLPIPGAAKYSLFLLIYILAVVTAALIIKSYSFLLY